MEKKKPMCITDEKVTWNSHYSTQYGEPSKNLQVELPHSSSISLLGIYQKKMKTLTRKKYMHHHVHCGIIYSSRDVEAT